MNRWIGAIFGAVWFTVGVVVLVAGLLYLRSEHEGGDVVPLTLIGMGALCVLSGAAIGVSGLRSGLRQRDAQRHGVAVKARLISAERTGTTDDVPDPKTEQCRLLFEYVDPAGKTRSGKTEWMPMTEANAFQAGEEVEILVDPAHGDRYAWVGKASSEAAKERISS